MMERPNTPASLDEIIHSIERLNGGGHKRKSWSELRNIIN
jgi:hypothetical protein